MIQPQQLLRRLDEIGQSLERSGHGLALIGLGSAGLETDRLDSYSDLDFFAIVDKGYKPRYLENLDWLAGIRPVAYAFRNTPDGFKLLFDDGIFCEFAVFELDELEGIPYAPGRMVWKRSEVEAAIASPKAAASPAPAAARPVEWLVGEALTNLYVGLCRYRRGEKLSAQRFVQQYAVERVVELAGLVEEESPAERDPFAGERRFEQRFPALARRLPEFVGGYNHIPESALAILDFIEQHFGANPALAQEMRRMARR